MLSRNWGFRYKFGEQFGVASEAGHVSPFKIMAKIQAAADARPWESRVSKLSATGKYFEVHSIFFQGCGKRWPLFFFPFCAFLRLAATHPVYLWQPEDLSHLCEQSASKGHPWCGTPKQFGLEFGQDEKERCPW